jgi:hypothetical protein
VTIVIIRSWVGTPSVEENKLRGREEQKPPHEPEHEQHSCGLLRKRRDNRHESWKQHRDQDAGEAKPEPGPAGQRASKNGTDESADRDGLE